MQSSTLFAIIYLRILSKNLHNIEFAKMRLKSAFAKEAYKSWRLLWHAAQVVGIANEYLVQRHVRLFASS